MSGKIIEKWGVKVAEYYKDEPSGTALNCCVYVMDTQEEALNKLNDIIREDWTTEVEIGGKVIPLADCDSYATGDGKYADTFYSVDGTLAWADNDNHAYRGEVFPMKIEI